jgi:hypothetical protein
MGGAGKKEGSFGMNAEIFAEWLRRQGHHIIRTPSSYWYDQGPRVYQAFPYHWVIAPADGELTELLVKHSILGIRYSTPLSESYGAASYHTVYEQPEYGMEQLGKWARKNVRRGLKNCVVEPVTLERLAEEGWELQVNTLRRQRRQVELDHQVWRTRFLSARDLTGFEGWAAMVDGKLAASVLTFQMEDCCYMLYQQCRAEYLTEHVNNALSFTVSSTMMARPEIGSIFYSLHSLDAPASIDQFKFRMGYVAKPVRQRVLFHPTLAFCFNPVSHAILRSARRVLPSNGALAKAEGMLRFYLNGRIPLESQRQDDIPGE